jgi:hypothetical protein
MTTTKSISDIISIQNSCKALIEELFEYETRPNDDIRQGYKNAKIDEALRLEILEYDSYDDVLSLSVDTDEYYRNRLGQNDETNIAVIAEQLQKFKRALHTFNIRVQNSENTDKEVKTIYQILTKIPALLRYNLQAIASNSIFAFKNEPNFDIKMLNLNVCKDEIQELIKASKKVDNLLKRERGFLKSINSIKVYTAVIKMKRNSLNLEGAFRHLFDDIKNYINQSVQDGIFIKKLKKLKELKDNNLLSKNSDIDEVAKKTPSVAKAVKEKRIVPDDQFFLFSDALHEIIKTRQITIVPTRITTPLEYDITSVQAVKKVLYNYPLLHKTFLAQNQQKKLDLISFLHTQNIEPKRILGVFVRMIKNYSKHYEIQENSIMIENCNYLDVRPQTSLNTTPNKSNTYVN